MKQYIEVAVIVPSSLPVHTLQSWARTLVKEEVARLGLAIDAQPQGPHTFADDGITLRQADDWSLSNRTYVGRVRLAGDIQCVATTAKGQQCRKAAAGRGFIGPVCRAHSNVR